jgi:hypothetical protein
VVFASLVERGTFAYAAFFCCVFNFAHLTRCAAAIFLRADADIMRFAGVEFVLFAKAIGCDVARTFAPLAFCACPILRRDAADITRPDWFACSIVAEPFNDSMTEIAWSKFSTRNCACLRSARSS